jgi:hypothetical protein
LGLVREAVPEQIVVNGVNLSWSGALLSVPHAKIANKEAVLLHLRCDDDDWITAQAQVVWRSAADDQQGLIGVRFTKLHVRDEAKLKHLLSRLAASPSETPHNARIDGQIEISLDDPEETLVALGQIHNGFLETIMFGPIRAHEPFPVTLAGSGGIPTLDLRARVLSDKALDLVGAAETLGARRVTLALDHPIDDLRRVTNPLISFLLGREDIATLDMASATLGK